MPEEVLNKLHAALYHISPLASDRERIIEQMGETIWIETLEKVLTSLDEHNRTQVIELLNAGELDQAVALFESSGIDLDAVIKDVSGSVLDEVLATANKTS